MVGPHVDVRLERGAVAIVFRFAEGFVFAEVDAGEVGVNVRAFVFVVFVEREQIAVEIQRLDRAAFGVGALDLPRHELRLLLAYLDWVKLSLLFWNKRGDFYKRIRLDSLEPLSSYVQR